LDLAVLGACQITRSGEDPTSNPTDLGTTSVQDESDSKGEALPKAEVRREVVLFTQAASRMSFPRRCFVMY
jgi:hypothetical protein